MSHQNLWNATTEKIHLVKIIANSKGSWCPEHDQKSFQRAYRSRSFREKGREAQQTVMEKNNKNKSG